MIDDYSGLQKAAILLITLGPEKASAIFQHLKEDEIESLTLEIANTRSVSPQDKESVLDEYYQVCLAQQYIAEGGIGYAKELLEKALGSEKAQGVISKLTASLQVRPFEFVRKYFKGIINLRGDIVPVMSARIKMGLDDDVYTSSTRIIILKLEEKGEIGLIVDEVCEVVTLVVDEIDKPNIDASSTGKELFINGIGKNGDELISLFEIGSIVSDKDAN